MGIRVQHDVRCVWCGDVASVHVRLEDVRDWKQGKLAQNAFPYLTPTERDVLITQLCPRCQPTLD